MPTARPNPYRKPKLDPMKDPNRQPPGYVAVDCAYCGEFTAWVSPPAPPVPVVCTTQACRSLASIDDTGRLEAS